MIFSTLTTAWIWVSTDIDIIAKRNLLRKFLPFRPYFIPTHRGFILYKHSFSVNSYCFFFRRKLLLCFRLPFYQLFSTSFRCRNVCFKNILLHGRVCSCLSNFPFTSLIMTANIVIIIFQNLICYFTKLSLISIFTRAEYNISLPHHISKTTVSLTVEFKKH